MRCIRGEIQHVDSFKKVNTDSCGSGHLKRIVVLSSTAAVISTKPEPTTFTESDWNDEALEVLGKGRERLKAGQPSGLRGFEIYRASKALAEQGTQQSRP